MSLAAETRETLAVLGVRPQKRRGQNFMVDAAALEAIAEAAAQGNPAAVVEIGPGLGFLTRELLKQNKKIFAVEKDRIFAPFLNERFHGQGLTVLEKDILRVDLKQDLGIREPVNVCGNIPYNITSPIVEWLIGQRNFVRRAVLTVQLEMAHRLEALPATKEWGALSVFVQAHAEVRLIRKIPRSSFFPSPKVDSAAVECIFLSDAVFPAQDRVLFFKLVRRAFQKRRKTILNALMSPTDSFFLKKRLTGALNTAGIDPNRRPETLTVADWARLSDSML